MKKFLSFLLVTCFSVTLFGQTFLVENFDGSTMPAGWTVLNNPTNWSISNTINSGGDPRELHLSWSPQFNGKSRVSSPVINTTGATDMVIEFLHFLDNYSGANTIGIETSGDGGSTWNLAFQQSFSSSGARKTLEVISTPDVGSSNFKFCVFFNGSSYNINDWFFDNFKLFARHNNDAAMSSINNATYSLAGDRTVSATVSNVGLSTINTIQLSYQINDLPVVTETFTSFNLATLQSKTVDFAQPANLPPGSYTLTVEILTVNGAVDDNPEDNLLTKNLYTASQPGVRKVCIEHFTSATCGPCVNPNQQMTNLLNNPNNQGKYSITKYQMNWPGIGDPYYTAEDGVRRTYYGVNAVPMIYWGAQYSMSINQTHFDNKLAEPAFIEIEGDFTIDGNNINISGLVHSYIDIPSARLYVIVNEKHTTGNTVPPPNGNGETNFYHVMMKMVPDANGTTINMQLGETYSFDFTQNMSGTHVEEMNDLEVHVFVQDYNSKYIFNSNFLTGFLTPAPINFVAEVDQETKSVSLSWDDAGTSSDSFTLFFNGNILQENITETNYIHENVPAGEHTYGVRAVKNSIPSSITATLATVCGENPENLSAEQVGNSVVLTWEVGYPGTYKYNVSFDGEIIASNINTTQYTHTDVSGGEHKYGILAVLSDCPFTVIETTIVIDIPDECYPPKNFKGEYIPATKSVALTWEDANTPSDSFTLSFNGEILLENIMETTFTHREVPEGNHTYSIYASVGDCNSESVETNVLVEEVGINEFENIAKIYPNPAHNIIYVEGSNLAEISIFNNAGQLINSIIVTDNITKIGTKNLSSGIYLMQVKTTSGLTKTEKIVITK